MAKMLLGLKQHLQATLPFYNRSRVRPGAAQLLAPARCHAARHGCSSVCPCLCAHMPCTQGRDHVWLTPHDEGGCWLPTEVYRHSIILTHFGRMDANHASNTAFPADNYSMPWVDPGGWVGQLQGAGANGTADALRSMRVLAPAFGHARLMHAAC
jgi:hypothetical protein